MITITVIVTITQGLVRRIVRWNTERYKKERNKKERNKK